MLTRAMSALPRATNSAKHNPCSPRLTPTLSANKASHHSLLKWLLDVSRGMSYLHGTTYYDADKNEQVRGIIHRDLKPDNCLVTETWGVKIADLARRGRRR